jgi:hypothetical protein
MKVLMLSTDMKIFEADSSAARRMASYAAIADEVRILVVGAGQRKEARLAENVRAVAAGGANKAHAFFLALSEAHALTKGVSVLTSQDPFFLGLIGLSTARRFGIPLQIQLHTDCFSSAYRSESPRRFFEYDTLAECGIELRELYLALDRLLVFARPDDVRRLGRFELDETDL